MEVQAAVQARVGSVLLGKWALERVLGVGGMAAVYVGVHKIGRRDAIKILHPEAARMATSRARFEREARAVNLLKHPGAVEIRDIDTTEDGAPFLVMELLEGETLLQRIRGEGLDLAELLRVVDDLLDVLVVVHGAGIVHRDIKPENLFLQTDGRLKVLDFGVASMRPTGAKLTLTGVAIGTIPFMSPEQILGDPVIDGRTDLFAVGAMLFRLVAKRMIHQASEEKALIIKMATEARAPAPLGRAGRPRWPGCRHRPGARLRAGEPVPRRRHAAARRPRVARRAGSTVRHLDPLTAARRSRERPRARGERLSRSTENGGSHVQRIRLHHLGLLDCRP